MIRINRDKAEDLVRNRLREQREPRMKDLDLAVMIASESAGSITQIAHKKQELRDVTSKDFSALTIEQLSSLDLDGALAL